ncbi:hypothetical protein RI103_20600 [Paraburkholderia sp. FT54]|uniref:hypothetical protein n=1 Tax=Paraburkholderia sp. FT54 TaxID=3074437 RepID=UPI002877A785|nr:hypothetical protein [Paraburkholderia sp. FT54]WNC93218.1 hypothetical protein RI103_20600 [Paraburkholderia sp. FT54]
MSTSHLAFIPFNLPRHRLTMKLLTTQSGLPRVSWGSVIAGVILSLIAYLILSVLGAAIGTSSLSPLSRPNPLQGFGFGSGSGKTRNERFLDGGAGAGKTEKEESATLNGRAHAVQTTSGGTTVAE